MELLSELPIDLQHKVLYFVAEHPVAKIIKYSSTTELDLEINEQEMFAEIALEHPDTCRLFCDSCRLWIRNGYTVVGRKIICKKCCETLAHMLDPDDDSDADNG